MTPVRSVLLRAEVALAAVTLAVVLGMGRLFDGNRWALPLLANAVAAHVVVSVCRRRGLSLITTLLVSVPAAILAVSWSCYWSFTTFGVPTGSTWSAMGQDLDEAWTVYQEVVAPAPVLTGFLLVSAVVVWGVAYVADWAAFRLWVPFEATLAAGTLFLFTALLGDPKGRGLAVGAFAITVIAFVLMHRMARQDGATHWVGDRREGGHRWLLAAGGGLGVVAVLLGTLFGPTLPGSGSEGLLDPDNFRNDTRVTVSPLVDIRARLVDQANVEVFQVRSAVPSYWRLTSLDHFDGEVWKVHGDFSREDEELPIEFESTAAAEAFDQTFAISGLAQIWLPAAFDPRAIDVATDDVDVRFDKRSATLIVDTEMETSDGLVYTVTSASPRIGPESLTGTPEDIPDDVYSDYTQLDDDFSPEIRRLAETLTAGAATPYEAALALQDHLRGFTYDLSVPAGQSEDQLREFLFETQRGFCQQFAGSFAAMARSIGLPTRVAVGFTQGERDQNDPNLFRVRGEHAHAWPEVYFAGTGWVAFEPTPGRGMPFAESYTGVQPAQAESGNPGGVDTSPTTTEAPTETPTPTLPEDLGRDPRTIEETPIGGGEDVGQAESWFQRWAIRPLLYGLAGFAALALLYGVTVPALIHLGRWRRRRRATTPNDRVALAWVETTESLSLLGPEVSPSETPDETAHTLASPLVDPEVQATVHRLARLLEESSYSIEGSDELAAELAEECVGPVRAAVRAQMTPRERVQAALDPRPHLRRRAENRRGQQRRITTTIGRRAGAVDADTPSDTGRDLTLTGERS